MQQTEITPQKNFTKCPRTPWTIAIAVSGFLFVPVVMLGAAGALVCLALSHCEPSPDVADTLCLVSFMFAALMSLVQMPCSIGLLLRKKWGLNRMYRYAIITLVLMLISYTFYVIQGLTGYAITGNNALAMGLAIGYCCYLLACWAYLRKLRRIRN